MTHRERLLLKIARLHFADHLGKGEIVAKHGEELGVTLKTVGDMIEEAAQWLLREKERLDDLEAFQRGDVELGRKVAEKFGLRFCQIATLPDMPKADLIKTRFWPDAAAKTLDTVIETFTAEGMTPHIAVSGGELVMDVLNALPYRRPAAHWYPIALIGHGRINDADIPDPNTNASIGWGHSGRLAGHLHAITVPPYENLPAKHPQAVREIRRQIMEEFLGSPEIRKSLHAITDKANILLTSIGTSVFGIEPPSSADLNALCMTPPFLRPYGIDFDASDMAEILGDLGHQFFVNIGQDKPEWRLLLGPGYGTKLEGIAYFRERAKDQQCLVIAVAVGVAISPVLLCALFARLLNVLICDRETGEALLTM